VRRVLIANRGEIALRVVRACRELGLRSIAVHSDADRDSLHVRRADEHIRIGPAHPRDSYLNAAAIIAAARETRADAIHPGYGFLAESARFAADCEEAGIVFVGPTADAIEQLGNKARARELAREAGVPTVPGTAGTVSAAEAFELAEEIGYPLLFKAAAGGGGRGIRVVQDPGELESAAAAAARDAAAAFGDDSLYIEKLLVGARHVEVQLLADTHGNVLHLYERECSLQRRRQKIFEEAPSPAIDGERRVALAESAARLGRAVGYTNAGTAEFLLDRDGAFYFIEMNTRIQVEHPVTELVTGIDIVKEQLRVAAGERLSFTQEEVACSGTAFEFRINAEDPTRGFMPSPGTITALELPGGPGVRVDACIYEGYTIPPFYDSLVAKLLVWGRTRQEALARGTRALEELRIDGIQTTIALHLELLADERVRTGDYDVGFLERYLEAPEL
jgi:acetyl-CoA carboxylase, biotin carboxylase subunit